MMADLDQQGLGSRTLTRPALHWHAQHRTRPPTDLEAQLLLYGRHLQQTQEIALGVQLLARHALGAQAQLPEAAHEIAVRAGSRIREALLDRAPARFIREEARALLLPAVAGDQVLTAPDGQASRGQGDLAGHGRGASARGPRAACPPVPGGGALGIEADILEASPQVRRGDEKLAVADFRGDRQDRLDSRVIRSGCTGCRPSPRGRGELGSRVFRGSRRAPGPPRLARPGSS